MSRYSTIMTKLIGSNPIAVLATLLLMSYAKILKNILEIYASVQLDYPNNKRFRVWLKDANVPYLKSHHLILAIVGSIFITLFFLPYTFFVLLGFKLYPHTRKKHLRRFMMRVKPLLDSYYAPYKKNTRYWTGLQLLILSSLYITFSFDSIGGTNYSLFAINAALIGLMVIAWLSEKIYKDFHVNVVEAVVYLNLFVISTATSNEVNSTELVYTLVGIVLCMYVINHYRLLRNLMHE